MQATSGALLVSGNQPVKGDRMPLSLSVMIPFLSHPRHGRDGYLEPLILSNHFVGSLDKILVSLILFHAYTWSPSY